MSQSGLQKLFPKTRMGRIFLAGGIGTFLLLQALVHRYQRGPNRNYKQNLKNKIIIITGASAGIGKETARRLAYYGGTIVFACRNKQKTLPIIEKIKRETKNPNLIFMQVQLDDYDSVASFVQEFKSQYRKVDILINNAGAAQWSNRFNKASHEVVFATNHLGTFLLSYLLKDSMSNEGRMIFVSSIMHKEITKKVDFTKALQGKYLQNYSITKYCGVLMSRCFQDFFEKERINCKAVSLHPGVVRTELLDKAGNNIVLWAIFKLIFFAFYPMILSESEGAMTTEYTALVEFNQLVPKGYYERNQLSKPSANVDRLNQTEELWNWTLRILKLV